MTQKSKFKTIKVSQLGTIITGRTPPRKIKEFFGDKTTWIKPTDMQLDARFVEKTEEKFSEKAHNKYSNFLLPPLSTCVVTIGSIGKKICLTNEDSFTNQAVNTIIPNTSEYDPMYVFYLMKYNLNQLQARQSGTTSGRDNMSKGFFENIQIRVVDLPSQKIIANIISKYDDLIENYTKQIKIMGEIITLIFSEWFSKLKFSGHESKKMVNSELGKLPEDWKIGTLKDLGVIQPGYAFKSKDFQNEGYGIIKIKNIENGKINLNTKNFVSEKIFQKTDSKLHVTPNSVLIALTGTEVGEIGITPKTGLIFLLNQRVGKVMSKHPCLFYEFLKTEEIQETMHAISNSSTAQKNISNAEIEDISIKLPNSELVEKFDILTNPLFEQIAINLQKINVLKSIRDSLLPNLLSEKNHVLDLGIKI
jgi:type I restriction enzyme, S subunit